MWRALLRTGELPYSLAIQYRNRRYDRGRGQVHRVQAPVISVGNLTTGGTGKTPMVEWLARWFTARDVRVAVISRGYGAERGSLNDEARELQQRLPNVPHLQNPDRVAAAQTAIAELDCQLILLDDAFQHRRLHRDLDLVLIDALEPFGYGHLLPRGLLREPLTGLRRAHIVALSHADMLDVEQRYAIRQQVLRFVPCATWIEVVHRPHSLVSFSGESAPRNSLRGRSIAAFCGIGNPEGFRRTLEACEFHIADFRRFPDHYAYHRDDVASLADWATQFHDLAALICTHKDLVKIGANRIGPYPLWALTVRLEITSGHEILSRQLAPFIPLA